VPDDSLKVVAWKNAALINSTLHVLCPGDQMVFGSSTYYLMGGIKAANLQDVLFLFEGELFFSNTMSEWPRINSQVMECLHFENLANENFTSKT